MRRIFLIGLIIFSSSVMAQRYTQKDTCNPYQATGAKLKLLATDLGCCSESRGVSHCFEYQLLCNNGSISKRCSCNFAFSRIDLSDRLSDTKIVKIIIQKSITNFKGDCPCPESYDRLGARCGNRSAWIRGCEDKPKCFAFDVTAQDIQLYRFKNKQY